jgi:ribosomal protein S3AE
MVGLKLITTDPLVTKFVVAELSNKIRNVAKDIYPSCL